MRNRALVLAGLLAAGSWAAQAVATPAPDVLPPSYLYSFVGITNNLSADPFDVEVEDFQTLTTATAFASGQVPDAPSPFAARGQASAQYSLLGALAEAVGQAAPGLFVPGGYAAFAAAMFTDGFTINGGSGTAFTSTNLSGTVGASADSIMAYTLLKSATPFNDLAVLEDQLAYIIANGELPPGLEVVHAALASPSQPLDPLPTGSYTYVSGVPVYLAGVLLTYAEQSGSAVFSNTASFGITPGGGTLATTSTFVYVNAVPEPGTWAMMIAGIALLGFVARRRVARA